MSLFGQKEIRGVVAATPHYESLNSRQLTRGSRNVPRITFRMIGTDGRPWTVVYTGEMDGQPAQGDRIAAFGYERGYGALAATEIWLVGYVAPLGQPLLLDMPIRIAKKRVFF